MKFIVFVLIFFSVVAWGQPEKAEVRFNEMTTVRINEPILLAHVATYNGVSADQADKLNSIVVHEGVSSEGVQEIKNQEIVANLRQKMSFADSQRIVFKIPTVVKFKASRSHIYMRELTNQIMDQARILCGKTCVLGLEEFHLPQISSTTEVISYRLDTKGLRQSGSFVLPLIVETSKGRQNLWVTGKISFQKLALVAQRMLMPGDKVSDADVREELVDVSLAKDGVPTKEDLQFRVVSRPLRVGQTIYFGDLKAVNAAERGEPVKIVLGDEAYEVSMIGVAEQSGSLGQTIKVKTPEKKILVGELIEERVVRVK